MFLNVGNIVAESRFRFRTRVSCSGISRTKSTSQSEQRVNPRTVFGSAFGAEHDQNHIPHAIPAVSAFHGRHLTKPRSACGARARQSELDSRNLVAVS